MGIIALVILLISLGGASKTSMEWIFVFENIHIITFFTTMFFVLHGFFLMYTAYRYRGSCVRMTWTAESELLEKIKSQNFIQRFFYKWFPFLDATRKTTEYKCVELLFCDSYWLPVRFDVPMYLSSCFERYALRTVNVGMFNWSVLAMFIVLNFIRIKFHLGFNCVDPERYSDSLIAATSDVNPLETGRKLLDESYYAESVYSGQGTSPSRTYVYTPIARRLGASVPTFPVDEMCYARITYFVFICVLCLVFFTLLVLFLVRKLEMRLLRRLGVRTVEDFEEFLFTTILNRSNFESNERRNRGRATMEQLLTECEECADEHEQEEEEEWIYKELLYQYSQFSDHAQELFENVKKPLLRWINELKLKFAKKMAHKVEDVTRILDNGNATAILGKLEPHEAGAPMRSRGMTQRFVRVKELQAKLEALRNVGSEDFSTSDTPQSMKAGASIAARLHRDRAAENDKANDDTSDEESEKNSEHDKVDEVSPAKKIRSASEDLRESVPAEPSGDSQIARVLMQRAKETDNEPKPTLVTETMVRRKSIVTHRRKSIFSSVTEKVEPASEKAAAPRPTLQSLGRALSGQLISKHASSDMDPHGNSELAKFREKMDAQYMSAEVEELQNAKHSIGSYIQRNCFKKFCAMLPFCHSAVSQDPLNDLETGTKRMEALKDPSERALEAMAAEDLRREVRQKNEELYKSDMSCIYFFGNSIHVTRVVGAIIMLHCFYLGLWATNFVSIIIDSPLDTYFWEFALILPLCLISLPALAHINKITSKLEAISNMDLTVMQQTTKTYLESMAQMTSLRESILERVTDEGIPYNTLEQKLSLVDSLFGAVDIDSSQSIDQYEFRVLLKQLDLNFSDARFHILFLAVNIEAAGIIKKYEFYNLLFPSTKQQLREIKQYYARDQLHLD